MHGFVLLFGFLLFSLGSASALLSHLPPHLKPCNMKAGSTGQLLSPPAQTRGPFSLRLLQTQQRQPLARAELTFLLGPEHKFDI